jgi:dCMP deaminase
MKNHLLVRVAGDTSTCVACMQSWDTNDQSPPICRPLHKPQVTDPMQRYLKFIPMLDAIASMSKDPSTKVGALAFDTNMNIISTGYNGFPRGVVDVAGRYDDRELKYKLISHAEQNLVAQAAYAGKSLKDSTLMVSSLYPCSNCAKSIIQSGVKVIISPPPDTNPRWQEESLISQLMFKESGITTFYIFDGRIVSDSFNFNKERE